MRRSETLVSGPGSVRSSLRLAAAALAVACAALSGCASSKVSVRIDSKADANGGAPFYVVVRAVDQSTFVTESYETIAGKTFQTPKDPSLVTAEVVYPGAKKEIVVEKPKGDQGLGVYLLFTKPGERWKTARNAPLPDTLDLTVGASQIDAEE